MTTHYLTLGRRFEDSGLPFPVNPLTRGVGYTLRRHTAHTHEFTSSRGTIHTAYITKLADYRFDLGTARRDLAIYGVNTAYCPVNGDCHTNGHSALFAVDSATENDMYFVYDLPSMLINGGVAGLTELGFHASNGYVNTELEAITNAIDNTFRSFMVPSTRLGRWPYALTVFDGPIVCQYADSTDLLAHITFSASKRLLNAGESLYIPSEDHVHLAFMVSGDVVPANEMPLSSFIGGGILTYGNATSGDVGDTATDSPFDAIHSDANSVSAQFADGQPDNPLATEVVDLRARLATVESILDDARDVAARYTSENSGCDEGKRRFLTELGLWPDATEAEIAELAGCPINVEYSVDFTVSVRFSRIIEMSAGDAESASDEDVLSMFGEDIDDMTIEALRYGGARVSDVDMEWSEA